MPIVRIGRGDANDVVIGQPEISRHHCRLTWNGSRYVVQDLGSKNGTYVNGMRVRTSKDVYEGDLIGVGQSLLLSFSGRRPAAAPPMRAASAEQAPSGSMLRSASRQDPTPTLSFITPDLSRSVPADLRQRLLGPVAVLSGLAASLTAAVAAGFNLIRASYQAEPMPS
jgi:pSer/pThr/pTyr-binding forkhead associated (FHA) protein